LLQSDDPLGSLELVGKALADQLRMDSAMLIIRAASTEYIVGFDRAGLAQRSDTGHPLYRDGLDCVRRAGPVRQTGHLPNRPGKVLAAGVPTPAPIAALVVQWDRDDGAPDTLHQERLMTEVTELAVAALGKIHTRTALEQLVWDQYAELANTAQVHADEMARRDRVEDEIRMLSLTDVMTGLRNRRGFYLEAEQAFKVARRQQGVSAVIFADVDGLKRVNDDLGHDAGDRLICDAAQVLRASFRSADVLARLGGDEFVAFTLNDEHPKTVLERIHRNLHAFNLMEERPYRVSLSTGIVQCDPAAEMSLYDYVAIADKQMYAQKQRRLH
jgi:diguanylate cyclase (GGDEF)-like protein